MRVLVLGSGVVGVSTAWYLARAGHQVTVVDRQPGAALETSFANAGQVSPGYASPWAAPGIPLKALKWMFQKHAPLAVRLDGSLFQLQWMAAMLRNCSAELYAVNKERMVRLAEYSRDCLKQMRASTGIAYEGRQYGTLQVFRTQAQLDAVGKDVAVLRDAGVPYQLLSSAQLAGAEPALAHVGDRLLGGLRLPGDETGDCQMFTTELARLAHQAGVEFRYGVQIQGLVMKDGRVDGVRVAPAGPHGADDATLLRADQYVMALGSFSREFAMPAGLRLPVYPLKGYSLTVPIVDAERAPVSTVMDETYKIAVTRFENRIRVGGMAEVAGFDLRLNPKRRATLAMVVDDLFAGAGDTPNATFWTGLRPMTPDGTPIVGATPVANLWLNTGHGTLGWTMACGSGQLLADLISQRRPAIDPSGLDVTRYLGRQARASWRLQAAPQH